MYDAQSQIPKPHTQSAPLRHWPGCLLAFRFGDTPAPWHLLLPQQVGHIALRTSICCSMAEFLEAHQKWLACFATQEANPELWPRAQHALVFDGYATPGGSAESMWRVTALAYAAAGMCLIMGEVAKQSEFNGACYSRSGNNQHKTQFMRLTHAHAWTCAPWQLHHTSNAKN